MQCDPDGTARKGAGTRLLRGDMHGGELREAFLGESVARSTTWCPERQPTWMRALDPAHNPIRHV